ncbi:MAG TPA: transcription antitermination factor NusB [Mycobacteriales bacterium]|nr:transcription antitermination factor NusB [Mycobacteriales bacterium]
MPAGRVVVDPARGAAVDVLRAVTDRGAYANLLLPSLLAERRIAGRDADFATELTYGTLRVRGTLDAVIEACAGRPLAAVDPPVLDLLRLGAYQILYLRTPDYAAVSATVDDAKSRVGARVGGFVNAVLRRVAGQDLAGWVAEIGPPYDADPVGQLALRHAHPEWVVAAFREALGGDLAETAAALAADNERPLVHLAARPGRITRDELVTEAGGEPGPWSPYAVRLPQGDPGKLPAIRRGLAHVQDEGSQVVALALAAVPLDRPSGPGGPDRPGETWLDLCAGPGGKAALLGALAAPRGARLLAVERNPRRTGLVAGAVRGLPVLAVTADGLAAPVRPGSVDRVLVDAPCTGLGALRRRPEARWRRQPADIPALTRLQRGLLTAALAAVRPGGVVAYVTCSPHVAETRAVVAEVLHRSGGEQLDARPYLPPDLPDLGPGPAVQLWPHRHGTDAMFLALLRR